MGIILGALGGMGEQMANIGASRMKADMDSEARVQESNLALQRAQALEQFKMDVGDKMRANQSMRIGAEAGRIADADVGKKRGIIESNITDRESWTPEMQSAVDQSLAIDKSGIVNDAKTRTQAAINTGDIDPKSAATLTQKDDALLYKSLWEQSKEEGRNARSDARIQASAEESDKRLAVMMAGIEARANKAGKADTAREALTFLEGSRKQVQSEEQNLRQLYQAELKDKSPKQQEKIKAEYEPKFSDVSRKRSEIESDYNAMRERVGLPARGASQSPPPAAAAPATAPASSPVNRASQFKVIR